MTNDQEKMADLFSSQGHAGWKDNIASSPIKLEN